MIINHNIAAINTYNKFSAAGANQAKSMEKLSSGLRINKAGDDAAGLAISEKMRGQVRGLDQASRNSQDAISLIQTAEGALNETHSILQRMRELAVQAGNDTNTDKDRGEIQKEINELTSEINRIGNTTEFNTQKLLDGSKDVATSGQAAVSGSSGTTGVFKIAVGDVASGAQSITIDGEALSITFASGGASGADATKLKEAISGNTALSAKYDVKVSGGTNVILTQKTNTTASTLAISGSAALSGSTVTSGAAAVAAKAEVKSGASLQFQIGANEKQSLTLDIADMRSSALGLTGTGSGFASDNGVTNGTDNTKAEKALDVSTHAGAANAVTKIQEAIDKVSAERSKLGATQNRLEHTINNLGTSSENLTAAESRIRDVDMAKEMMNQTKNSIMSQAAQAMLAQANQQPQGVLQLLG
ncbi:flagellin [Domibacillus robiginosus]|uniref:flagellin N-terminal helical domain-containing protein n=1 Tax=Domibacillus robiginosus TaxID=1071054 RepID=UPI00067BAD96|nr:flagellin [Domibacillus robiginosus]